MNIGDRIPDVLGIDQHGNEIKSSDYRGGRLCFTLIQRQTPAKHLLE